MKNSQILVVLILCLVCEFQGKKIKKHHQQRFEPHGTNSVSQNVKRAQRLQQNQRLKSSSDGWVVEQNGGGKLQVHIELPTKKIDDLIKMMDYDTEKHCIFKEGFVANIVKSNCQSVWAKPNYILLTPESFKLCLKAEESTCHTEVKLCQVSHMHIPTDWQSSPCFQVMGKEKDENGHDQVLAQLCASDYAASLGWQHAILSYHRCSDATYTH